MTVILITGVPAAGKSTLAEALSARLNLPVLSKDGIKERLFDTIGFTCREEKARLGVAATQVLYYAAEQLLKAGQTFLMENNFENASREGLIRLLETYHARPLTIRVTGDDAVIYERFVIRDKSPMRHRGHVVNDRYPEETPGREAPVLSYEAFVSGIKQRGMASFDAGGPCLTVDTTDWSAVDVEAIAAWVGENLQ
ncbi:MAG: AAA family ATPase [Christensenellaceae bacterium]|nr:AAA family ATPase [Christensenellaceae bacterium]